MSLRLSTLSFLAVAATILSACEIAKPVEVACPQVKVLQDVGNIIRFQEGQGRDITDIVLEAEFQRVVGECEVSDEFVEVAVYVELSAAQGAALRNSFADAGIFMAVADPERRIMSRRSMPVKFAFPGNRSRISYIERFLVDIPKTEAQKAENFVVYMGFELSREELQFNRLEKNF